MLKQSLSVPEGLTPDEDQWRHRIYSAYVSSGQARHSAAVATPLFEGREHYLQQIVRRHLPVSADTPILDLGCGHGAFVHFLRLHGFRRVSGIDVSQEQIDLANSFGVEGLIRGELMDYLAHTGSESVGVVLLMDVLEHMTRSEIFRTLDEIFRVLAPGGRCLIHVPNAEGIFGARIRYADLTHEQSFTPASARQLLNTIGFCQVSSYEEKPIPHGLKSLIRRAIWDIGTAGYRLLFAAETGNRGAILSQNMLVVARKPPVALPAL